MESTVSEEPKKEPDVKLKFTLNVSHKQATAQIKHSIRLGLPQVQPHETQEGVTVLLVGGGPSLEDTFDDLKARYDAGYKVIATNNTHDWLIERGVEPSAYLMIDAREHNAGFVQNPIDRCKYLIASQCHPAVFEALKDNTTFIFHCGSIALEKPILDRYYFGNYFPVIGGSTVILRGLSVLRLLGFENFEVYGFDSCYMNDKHHAYKQHENEGEELAEVKLDGKIFQCSPWMFSQAKEFIDITKAIGEHFNIAVHGDGLISHIIKTGATQLEERNHGSNSVVAI